MLKEATTVIQYGDIYIHKISFFLFHTNKLQLTYASNAETHLCMTPWLSEGRTVIPLIDKRNKGLLTLHVISDAIYNVPVFICFSKQIAEQKQTLLKLQTCEYTKDNGLKLHKRDHIFLKSMARDVF